jgi:hypothetical protein
LPQISKARRLDVCESSVGSDIRVAGTAAEGFNIQLYYRVITELTRLNAGRANGGIMRHPKRALARRRFLPFTSVDVTMPKRSLLYLTCALLLVSGLGGQTEKKEKKFLKNADVVLMTQNHFDDDTLIKIIDVFFTM